MNDAKTPYRHSLRTTGLATALALCMLSDGLCPHRAYFHAHDPGTLPPDIAGFVDALSDRFTSRGVGLGGGESFEHLSYARFARRLDRQTALRLLYHPKPSVRVWMAEHVTEHLRDDAKFVLPLLHDDSPLFTQFGCVGGNEHTVAEEVIAFLLGGRYRPLLEQVAQDRSLPPEIRAKALRGVGPENAEVVERVAKELLASLKGPRWEVFEALKNAHAPHAFGILRGIIGDSDARDRKYAITALAATSDPNALAALDSLCSDAESDVRETAIVAYAASPAANPEKARRYLESFYSDIPEVKRKALFAKKIAELGTEVVPRFVDDAPQDAQVDAIRELWYLHELSPSLRAWLRKKVNDATPVAQTSEHDREFGTPASEALNVLAKDADRNDVDLARRFLQSANDREHEAAMIVLIAAGDIPTLDSNINDDNADRLFWLRSFTSIDAIRAVARKRDDWRLDRIADDLARVRGDSIPPNDYDRPPAVLDVRVTAPPCEGVTGLPAAMESQIDSLHFQYRRYLSSPKPFKGDVDVTFRVTGTGAVWRFRRDGAEDTLTQMLEEAFKSLKVETDGSKHECSARIHLGFRK